MSDYRAGLTALPSPDLSGETDCEDQGFSRIEDGCLACAPKAWEGSKPIYPDLVKRRVNGRLYWYCPNGHGSFGECESASDTRKASDG